MEEQKKESIRISFRAAVIILGILSVIILGSVFYMAGLVDDFADYKTNIKP